MLDLKTYLYIAPGSIYTFTLLQGKRDKATTSHFNLDFVCYPRFFHIELYIFTLYYKQHASFDHFARTLIKISDRTTR